MIDRDLIKHAGEFRGYIENHDYEVSDEGVVFPKAHARISGAYSISSPGYEDEDIPNLLPIEGINFILTSGLNGDAYLALFTTNYTPTSSITAAQFASTAGELVSNTEGYSETTRRLWEKAAASNGARDNLANRAAFTIATATSVVIRGAALLTDQVKGATTGSLLSISRFAQARTQYNGDPFSLGYRVRIEST